MKKFILITLGLLAFCGCMYLGCIYFLNSGFVADKIVAASKESAGSPVKFGQKPKISIFPPSITLGATQWSGKIQNVEFKGSLASGSVSFELTPLFSGKINIEAATFDGLRLELKTGAGGETKSSNTNATAAFPEIQKLVIQHGELKYIGSADQITLGGLNLSAENLRNRQDVSINCSFSLSTGSENPEWNIAFRTKARYYTPSLTLRECAATCTPAGENPWTWAFPSRLTLDGAINFDTMQINLGAARIDFPAGRISLPKEASFTPPRFSGLVEMELYEGDQPNQQAAPVTAISINTEASFSDNILRMEQMRILSGGKPGSGSLGITFPDKRKPLDIKGNLNFGLLRPLEFAKAFGSSGDTKTPDNSRGFSWPDVDVKLGAAALEIAKIRMENVALNINGQNGTYNIDGLNAKWAGGSLNAELGLNLPDSKGMINIRGAGIDLGSALAQFGAKELEGGQTTFNANLDFSGADRAAIAASLSGSGAFTSRDVKIRALEELFKYLPILAGKSDIPDSIALMEAGFHADKGVVRFEPLVLDAKGLGGKGAATLDLPKSRLDGHADIKAFGLNLPITFKGPFDNVSFGLAPDFFRRRP